MNNTIYTLYKTTNILNNKIYIGVHGTSDLENDPYLGSGDAIKSTVKKYGKTNFNKEILLKYDNPKEAYLIESIIGSAQKGNTHSLGYKHTDQSKINMSLAHIGNIQSEETKSKRSNSLKLYYKDNPIKNIGRKESNIHKKKRIESLPKGENHHLFSGYYHTHNGIFNTTQEASNNNISTL